MSTQQPKEPFRAAIAQHIWRTKYRFTGEDARTDGSDGDRTVQDSWDRIARALAAVEPRDAAGWRQRFTAILRDFQFLPAGRIQAGAGTGRSVTLFNCFVMGVIDDSIDGILDALKEGALTMQQGGGVGYDFSTLRPRGTQARGVGAIASGPVSFMDIWDATCATLLTTGARRGAMMATLRCDHPDIEEFITAKHQPGRLRNFNLSVQVTDAFMAAVHANADWPLVFPSAALDGDGDTIERDWPGADGSVACRVIRRIGARTLWQRIMRAAYDTGEPGVLFIDRINHANNLSYRERITATNPCGEIPLPPYGACDLGSINLTRFVHAPFGDAARLDLDAIAATAATAVRLLDNVIDASRYPLDQQRRQAHGSRRIGLGITGLADVLIMLGMRYGDDASLAVAERVMGTICHAAYRASVALAREKAPFDFFERDAYLAAPFIAALPADIGDAIARHGIRNSHLMAIAPTGTISLLANNVSSGIEPVFASLHRRRVLNVDGTVAHFDLEDYARALWRDMHGPEPPLPDAFVEVDDLTPSDHLAMQAVVQPFVDNAVSKTVNIPVDYPFEDFQNLYAAAYDRGLKGCTTFRPNAVTGAVLEGADLAVDAPHCCVLEREAD